MGIICNIAPASRLPKVGTSIFAVMARLAVEHNAINLSQGFPDFPVSEELIELVNKYMRNGYNQYAPMPGVTRLREAIAAKASALYDTEYDPGTEVTVTAGATEAIFCAISALVHPGDEVIVFEPAYDCYVPAVELAGGVPIPISLTLPDYRIDWQEVERRVNSRTRMIVINTPHNPTGTILQQEDLHQLARITRNTDIIILSDEVYEHIIFDDQTHHSVCRIPELAGRSMVMSSFGKTFHATGWKLGYCVAPAALTSELRKVHQFVVFCANTSVQYAIAEYLQSPANYENLGSYYQQKRDRFLGGLKNSRLKYAPAAGTYFQTLDYSAVSGKPEYDFAVDLVQNHGLAAVPNSAFYHAPKDLNTLRFCFAKKDSTLQRAVEVLNNL